MRWPRPVYNITTPESLGRHPCTTYAVTTSKLRWPHPKWREVFSLQWCSGGFLAYEFSVSQGVAHSKQICFWLIGYSTKMSKICHHIIAIDMLNLRLWCSKCIFHTAEMKLPHLLDEVTTRMISLLQNYEYFIALYTEAMQKNIQFAVTRICRFGTAPEHERQPLYSKFNIWCRPSMVRPEQLRYSLFNGKSKIQHRPYFSVGC